MRIADVDGFPTGFCTLDELPRGLMFLEVSEVLAYAPTGFRVADHIAGGAPDATLGFRTFYASRSAEGVFAGIVTKVELDLLRWSRAEGPAQRWGIRGDQFLSPWVRSVKPAIPAEAIHAYP